MKPSDAAAFKQLLTGVYSFYRAELTTFHVDVWWGAMKPYSFESVKDAFNRHVMNPDNGQFLPKPADVVKLVDGGTQDQALVAWTKFELGVTRLGPYQTVVFDDRLIHAVVADMGGWVAMCGKKIDDWPFVRNEFVTRYRALATRPAPEYPAKLIGIVEAHNAADWPQYVPAPKFIGNEDEAQLVLAHGSELDKMPNRRIGELLPTLRLPMPKV